MLTMDGKTCLLIAEFIAENKGMKAARKLQEKIEYLDSYGEDQGTTVRLFGYSQTEMDITFCFRSGRKMAGGLIYHEHDKSWGVHT